MKSHRLLYTRLEVWELLGLAIARLIRYSTFSSGIVQLVEKNLIATGVHDEIVEDGSEGNARSVGAGEDVDSDGDL